MIDPKRTRFILDGNIIETPKSACMEVHDDHIQLGFYIESGIFGDTDHYSIYKHAKLLNVDIVEEREHYRDDKGVTWTQFILESL